MFLLQLSTGRDEDTPPRGLWEIFDHGRTRDEG